MQKLVVAMIEPRQLIELYEKLMSLPPPPKRVPLLWSEVKGGMVIFLVGFLATFPIALPFILMTDPIKATYLSNGVGMCILFICGYSIGKNTGLHPWLRGFSMMLISIAFFLITLVLGG